MWRPLKTRCALLPTARLHASVCSWNRFSACEWLLSDCEGQVWVVGAGHAAAAASGRVHGSVCADSWPTSLAQRNEHGAHAAARSRDPQTPLLMPLVCVIGAAVTGSFFGGYAGCCSACPRLCSLAACICPTATAQISVSPVRWQLAHCGSCAVPLFASPCGIQTTTTSRR